MPPVRLFILVPECDAEGESPWDWVQNTQPWTEQNDAQWNGSGRLGEMWLPLKLRIVHRERSGDFYDFSTHPVVSPHAWDVLQGVVGESVEALPATFVAKCARPSSSRIRFGDLLSRNEGFGHLHPPIRISRKRPLWKGNLPCDRRRRVLRPLCCGRAFQEVSLGGWIDWRGLHRDRLASRSSRRI